MKSPTWRGHDDGHAPRFSARAHRWYAQTVRTICREHVTDAVAATAGPALIDEIVAWYQERWTTYVRYQPADRYAGDSYTAGGWVVLRSLIVADLASARAHCERSIEARRPPVPLGPIDVDAAIAALTAQLGSAPSEPCGSDMHVRTQDPAGFDIRWRSIRRRLREQRYCRNPECQQRLRSRSGSRIYCEKCSPPKGTGSGAP